MTEHNGKAGKAMGYKAGFKPQFPIRAPQFDRPKKTQAERI